MYRFVDAQCFAGGFTLGMVQAGFELVGKREMKGGFGVGNCEVNRHLLGDAWRAEATDYTEWSVPAAGAQVVAGNPPCSGFSVMSAKGFRGADSTINHCMWAFVDYAARVRPEVAVFESVQLAAKVGEGRELMKALRLKLEELTGDAYHLYHVMHNAYSVGGAAMRKRYFWLASRVPFGIEEPGVTAYPTLNDVIGDLQNMPLQWQAQQYDDTPPSWWAQPRRNSGAHGVEPMTVDGHMNGESPLHDRIRELIEWAEMRPREPIQNALRRCYEKHGELPPLWRYSQEKLVQRDFFQGYTAPVRWDGTYPARVITGGAIGCVIHPNLDRTITHRETARIMGFPDDWLIDPIPRGGLAITWGKGITVDCGRWIGEWIAHALDRNPGSYSGVEVGDRESLIDCTGTWQTGGKIVIKSGRVAPKRKIQQHMGGTTVSEDVNVETTSENPATESPAPAANRRGRPRPETTIARDAEVYRRLEAGPATKVQLAEATGLKESEVYLSLHRLKKDGKIRRVRNGSSHTWELHDGTATATDAVVPVETAETQESAPESAPAEGDGATSAPESATPGGPAAPESWI